VRGQIVEVGGQGRQNQEEEKVIYMYIDSGGSLMVGIFLQLTLTNAIK
jgi:hypothetical protein